MNAYDLLKKQVLPHLQNFKTDLIKHDRKLLNKYNGKFLYAYRDSGTNILCLETNSYNYMKDYNWLINMLNDRFTIFKGFNKKFLLFNGKELISLDLESLHIALENHKKEVMRKKELIDELNVKLMALDLFYLMNNTRSWKKVIEESNDSSIRKLRIHLELTKLKKTNDLEDIETQVYNNLLILKEV